MLLDRSGRFGLAMTNYRARERRRREKFARALDDALAETNEDYKAHRAGGFGMAAPEVRAVPIGAFTAWMKARGQLGGQHKVPRIINDGALLRSLLASLRR
jgi:hypothetical protein